LVGSGAGSSGSNDLTTGSNNILIGYNATASSATVSNEVTIGNSSVTRFRVPGIGIDWTSAPANLTGITDSTTTLNTALGVGALASSTGTFPQNTAVGYYALDQVTSGSSNTGIGGSAGDNLTTGINNVFAGFRAGNNLTTGSNNIVIGYNNFASSATVSNEITLGNSSIATLRCQVTTITSLSDERDKTNIVDLDAGLNLINAVRPVAFDWNMRDGGKVGEHDTGFIAQELQAAQEVAGVSIPGLVFDNNPEKLEAGYGKLLPVMVKAIQELSAKVDALQAELNQLKGA
jgi:hypothetical protein